MKPITPISPAFSPQQTPVSPHRTTSFLTTGPSVQPTQKLTQSNRAATQDTVHGAMHAFDQLLSDAQKRSTLRDDRQRLRDDQPVKTDDVKSKQVESKNKKEEGLQEDEAGTDRKVNDRKMAVDEPLVIKTVEQPTTAVQVNAEWPVGEVMVSGEAMGEQTQPMVNSKDAEAAQVTVAWEVVGEPVGEMMSQVDALNDVEVKVENQVSGTATTPEAETMKPVAVDTGTGRVTEPSMQTMAQTVASTNKAEQGPADATSHVGHVRSQVNMEVLASTAEGQTSEEGESEQANSQGDSQTSQTVKAHPPGAGVGTGPGAGQGPGAGVNAAMSQVGGEGQTVLQTAQPTTPLNNLSQTTATAASSFTQVTSAMQQGQGAMSEAGTEGDVNAARIARGLQSALAQRGGTVTLRLHPPELGILKVQMQIQEGQVRAQFMTDNAAAKGLLTQELGNLRTALERQGLTVERLEVQMQPTQTTNMQSGQQSMTQQDQPEDGRSRGQFMRQGGQGDSGLTQERGSEGRDEPGARSRRGFAEQLVNAMA